MITQNYVLDFMPKPPSAATEFKKGADILKTGDSQFKEFLDRTATRTSDNKTFYNSKKVNSDDKLKDKENSKNENVKAKSKDNIIAESLAQVMGVKIEDLMKILNSLNIKAEDLSEGSKAEEAINKLSELLKLNDSQKNALSEIVKLISNRVDASESQFDSVPKPIGVQKDKEVKTDRKESLMKIENPAMKIENPAMKIENPAMKIEDPAMKIEDPAMKIEDPGIRAVENNKSDNGTAAIAGSLKAKIEGLASELQQNPREIMNEVLKNVRAVLEQNNPVKPVVKPVQEELQVPKKEVGIENGKLQTLKQPENEKKTDVTEKQDVKSVKAEGVVRQDAKAHSNSDGDASSDSGSSKTQTLQSKNNDDFKPAQFNSLVADPNTKVSGTNENAGIHAETRVTKSEILNQVLEKAKVVINGDKSEMIMDLKPDSLGKLVLKVVTERGIVTAKFVAENQQVKEVLESNMQLLKNTLEKQGLSVQGFSVSVGQDSHPGFKRETNWGAFSNSGSNKISPIGTGSINVAEPPDNRNKLNPYTWSDSTINLTA